MVTPNDTPVNNIPVNNNETAPVQNDREEKKGGIGLVDGGLGAVGGIAGGVFVDKVVVDHSIKKNLNEPYAKEMQEYKKGVGAANLLADWQVINPQSQFPPQDITLENATADHILDGARGVFWRAKQETHETVKSAAQASDATQPMKDLLPRVKERFLAVPGIVLQKNTVRRTSKMKQTN